MAAGETIRAICQDLTRRHTPTPGQVLARRGLLSPKQIARMRGEWLPSTVYNILYSPDYSGMHLNYHTVSERSGYTDPATGLSKTSRRMLPRTNTTTHLPLDELLEEYADFVLKATTVKLRTD